MDPNRRSRSNSPMLAVIVVIAVVIIGGLIVTVSRNHNLGNFSIQTTSPNILYLTLPVYSFTGTVDKVNQDSIEISNTQVLNNQPLAAVNPDSSAPKIQTRKLTYEVKVSDQTFIIVPQASPAAAPLNNSASNRLTIQAIKVGDVVSAQSNTDLRTMLGNQFQALSITIAPPQLVFSGQVAAVNGNILTVRGFAPSALGTAGIPPQQQEFKVTVTNSTDISMTKFGSDPTHPQISKVGLADIKVSSQVTVTAASDVTKSTQVQATKINLVENIFPTALPGVASNSALPAAKNAPAPAAP